MHATTIVGYTYGAENFHPQCLTLPTGPGEKFDGWALADGVRMPVEDNLREIAAAFGIDYGDKRSYDSGDFPKPILAVQVESDDETCGKCGDPLVPSGVAVAVDEPYAHLEDPAEREWLTELDPAAVRDNAHRMYLFMHEQGVAPDSVLRELAFGKAAAALGIDYDVLYDAWLNETPVSRTA